MYFELVSSKDRFPRQSGQLFSWELRPLLRFIPPEPPNRRGEGGWRNVGGLRRRRHAPLVGRRQRCSASAAAAAALDGNKTYPSAAATAGKSTAWTKTNPRSTPPSFPFLSPPPFSFLRVRSPLDAKVAFAGRGGDRGRGKRGRESELRAPASISCSFIVLPRQL